MFNCKLPVYNFANIAVQLSPFLHQSASVLFEKDHKKICQPFDFIQKEKQPLSAKDCL